MVLVKSYRLSVISDAQHPGRGGRAAEGSCLLSSYGGKLPSRVRIPASPPFIIRGGPAWDSVPNGGLTGEDYIPCPWHGA